VDEVHDSFLPSECLLLRVDSFLFFFKILNQHEHINFSFKWYHFFQLSQRVFVILYKSEVHFIVIFKALMAEQY